MITPKPLTINHVPEHVLPPNYRSYLSHDAWYEEQCAKQEVLDDNINR
jgi:hypothetical protein